MRGMRLLAAVALGVGIQAQLVWAQATASLLPRPQSGDQTVSGFVVPRPATPAGYVIEVYEASAATLTFVSQTPISSFEKDGKFVVNVTPALAGNQWVRIIHGRTLLYGGEVVVKTASSVPPSPTVKLHSIRPGDRTVSGTITPTPGSSTGFTVVTYAIAGGGQTALGSYPVREFDKDGAFTVELNAPLAAVQRVEVSRSGSTLDGLDVPAPPAVRLSAPHVGGKNISGVFDPAPDDPSRFAIEVRTTEGTFVERKALDKIDKTTGTFAVALAAPLRSTQTVAVIGGGVMQPPVSTGAFVVSAFLQPTIFDGARTIHGYLQDSIGVASVRVKVQRSNLENEVQRKQYLQMKATSDFDQMGQFVVTLDQPVVAGQVVVAEPATGAEEESSSTLSPAVTVTDPGSWGRARAYFAGGVVFSKDRDDFSKQDLTLAFVIDKGWLQKADFKLGADTGEAARQRELIDQTAATCRANNVTGIPGTAACDKSRTDASTDLRSKGRFTVRGLNSFFDTRLTALPVATATPTTIATPATTATSTTTTTDSRFPDSRKGAVVQMGVYAPIFGPQTSWLHDGAVNALFVAPVFRVGIQTIPGDGTGAPTVNAKGERDDVFHFWGAGFGIGHQKLSGTTNQTPEIISYLHIVWGQSEAFDHQRSDTDSSVVHPRRTIVEGRLKIPSTPMQVGVDANLGDRRDDVRFVFGTRFDIGELFGRLKAFQ